MNGSLPRVRHISLHDVSQSDLARFPDFLVVGPSETGASWIHANLSAHPQIFLSEKSENAFIASLLRKERSPFAPPSFRQYLERMQDSPGQFAKKTFDALRRFGTIYRPQLIGDVSESYASLSRQVIEDITMLNPDLKVILVLRDPVERALAFAANAFSRQFGVTLDQVPQSELRVFFQTEYESQATPYSEMIERWQYYLGSANVHVGQFEELCAEPTEFLGELCRFLGVESNARFRAEDREAELAVTARNHLTDCAVNVASQRLSDQVEDYRQLLSLLDDQSNLALSG